MDERTLRLIGLLSQPKRAIFDCLVQKVKNFNFILIIIAGHVFMIILKFRLETSSGNTVEMEVLFLFQITS